MTDAISFEYNLKRYIHSSQESARGGNLSYERRVTGHELYEKKYRDEALMEC